MIAKWEYSITMARRTPDLLLTPLQSTTPATFEQLRVALGDASRATTFRYLKQVLYLRSYNHNGRYYTYRDPTRFDRWGLASLGDVHFSRDRSLAATVRRLVRESAAGFTQKELQALLRVRVQVVLLAANRQGDIQRERMGGFYLYLHGDPVLGAAQRRRRRTRIDAHRARAVDAVVLDPAVVIEVLLVLIRHPGSPPARVVRRLYGHSPPITLAQVAAVFSRYDLEKIGEKGGAANC